MIIKTVDSPESPMTLDTIYRRKRQMKSYEYAHGQVDVPQGTLKQPLLSCRRWEDRDMDQAQDSLLSKCLILLVLLRTQVGKKPSDM